MKLKEVVLGEWICGYEREGTLFFLPRMIDGTTVYGWSVYLPNEQDMKASEQAQEWIPRDAEEIYFGSIAKIKGAWTLEGTVTVLRQFNPATSKNLRWLIDKIFELKLIESKP